jgi:hypothetical protein
MKTTLNKIKEHNPCEDGWKKLLTFLNKTDADDEELSLLTILQSNGFNDALWALWALSAVEGHDKEIRLMACDFAESVVHLTNDERSVNAIKVSRDYANGLVTQEELKAAAAAASDAAAAASDAAAWAAWAAAAAASDAAAAASDAARAAAAWAAASDAGWAAIDARADEIKKQIQIFKKYVNYENNTKQNQGTQTLRGWLEKVTNFLKQVRC